MKKNQLLCSVIFLLCGITLHPQTRVYIYYMNDQMQTVPREQATIVGRGSQRDSVFLVQFYTLKENLLLQAAMFTDSTLSTASGSQIIYYANRKIAEKSVYKNNVLHGVSVKYDSLGRVTDSAMYYEDMPQYYATYTYNADGDRQKTHEFDNTYSKQLPDENAEVMTTDGTKLNADLWKSLMYINRYAFRKDKVAENAYLIFRFSDQFYNNMVAKDPKPKESDFFETGQDFNINEVDINGNKLRSKDLKGTVLVINYWFIGCKPCRMEMPELNELVKEYRDSVNVKFIGIALDDKLSIKDFLKQMKFDYQIVANGRIDAEKYGVHLYPTHVIVGGDGKVYFHAVSSPRQLFYWMRKTINELLEKQRLSSKT